MRDLLKRASHSKQLCTIIENPVLQKPASRRAQGGRLGVPFIQNPTPYRSSPY